MRVVPERLRIPSEKLHIRYIEAKRVKEKRKKKKKKKKRRKKKKKRKKKEKRRKNFIKERCYFKPYVLYVDASIVPAKTNILSAGFIHRSVLRQHI